MAFWTFVAARIRCFVLTPIVVSVVFSMLAMPASILGNELALRFGRHRAIIGRDVRFRRGAPLDRPAPTSRPGCCSLDAVMPSRFPPIPAR